MITEPKGNATHSWGVLIGEENWGNSGSWGTQAREAWEEEVTLTERENAGGSNPRQS